MESNKSHPSTKQDHDDHHSSEVNQRKRARVSSNVDAGSVDMEQHGRLQNDSGEDVTYVTYERQFEDGDDSTLLKGIRMAFPRHTEKGFAKAVKAEALSMRTLPLRQLVPNGHAPFKRVELLQKSDFIEVDKVESTSSDLIPGKVYVRKVLGVALLRDSNDAQRELEALEIPKTLSHKHIISIFMIYEELGSDIRRYGIVMEPVANGNLQNYLTHLNDPKSRTPRLQETVHKWFGCLASSLAYMHARDITHGNISPQNVLIKGDEIFFAEFAISQHFKQSAQIVTQPLVLTKFGLYSAPEPITPPLICNKRDVFSLGCVFLEMLHAVSGESTESLTRWRENTSYCENLSRVPDLLAVMQDKLSTAFLRSMVVCCQSMLEHNPAVRRTSFHVARFVFEAFERQQLGGGGRAEEWLKCNCLCPWQSNGGDTMMSLVFKNLAHELRNVGLHPGKYQLPAELAVLTLERPGDMKCPYCGTQYFGWATLLMHCKSEHLDNLVRVDGNYCCSVECAMLSDFPTKELLEEHERVHHAGRGHNAT